MRNRVCNSSFPKAANPATRHEFRLWILTTRPLRVSSAAATNTAGGKKSKQQINCNIHEHKLESILES
jgi:hypothetical protein